jgi:hypothetical protein
LTEGKLKKLIIILFFMAAFFNVYPQYLKTKPTKYASSSSVYPISIAAAAGLYLLNPIFIYDNKRLFMGLTKELSVGFGYFGEHRLSIEYSFIVSGSIRHHLRTGYKYDILLRTGLEPSNNLQGTGVLSIGAGYFYDFDKSGAFPEVSLGYSLRNHRLLLYPHVKLRHTFMFKKDESDITDLSFGFMVGIANPFIDVKIRRKY